MFTNQCMCLDKWEELLGSSQRTWHDWVGLMPTPFMLISVTSPYGYLNSYDACFTNCWTCHSTTKLAFCKIYLYHALLYLEPKHGLLASTFKVLIGLPLVILLARHERQDILKSSLVMIVWAWTLPSQNACRVKADGMGPSYRRRFPLQSYTQGWTIMVIICVRRYVWM